MVSFWISAAISAAVRPDAFEAEFMKAVIAAPRALVVAVAVIMLDPIIPPIDIEIWLPPFLPSMTPSAASPIMAVTIADETVMSRFLAYCDIAARVIP